jgi:hypothetical protein
MLFRLTDLHTSHAAAKKNSTRDHRAELFCSGVPFLWNPKAILEKLARSRLQSGPFRWDKAVKRLADIHALLGNSLLFLLRYLREFCTIMSVWSLPFLPSPIVPPMASMTLPGNSNEAFNDARVRPTIPSLTLEAYRDIWNISEHQLKARTQILGSATNTRRGSQPFSQD